MFRSSVAPLRPDNVNALIFLQNNGNLKSARSSVVQDMQCSECTEATFVQKDMVLPEEVGYLPAFPTLDEGDFVAPEDFKD